MHDALPARLVHPCHTGQASYTQHRRDVLVQGARNYNVRDALDYVFCYAFVTTHKTFSNTTYLANLTLSFDFFLGDLLGNASLKK